MQTAIWRIALAGIVAACVALGRPAAAQDRPAAPLEVSRILGGGVRASLTEKSWGKIDFDLTNPTDIGRRARVLVFYANQHEVQYGRDLWVPAHSLIRSWLPIGPAPQEGPEHRRDLQLLLYDLSHGAETLVLPATQHRVRERALIYRKREPTTVLVTDDGLEDEPGPGELPRPESAADEALTLARVMRGARGYSKQVQFASAAALPAWAKLFDGVDQLILASNHVAQNPVGMRGVRHWLEQGGTVWVMLDLVDPESVVALVGEALDFHLVGRVGLNAFHIDEPPTEGDLQQHELPVTLARVVLPPGESAQHTVDGWPVWFTRSVGRGKVLFTTLGPRAWHRPRMPQPRMPRQPRDSDSPFPEFPFLPVARDVLIVVVDAAQGERDQAYPADAFQSMLKQQIGYEIVGSDTVAAVFGLFLGGTLGLSLLARWRGRAQLAGWLGPAGALAAAVLLYAFGQASRQAVPPAVAVAQTVRTVDGSNEAAVTGLLAVYRPDPGTLDLGARDGGSFDLDMAGLEGQTRRLIMTDLDTWHWENLALPAGVRFAPMQFTAHSADPIVAVAHFGPAGIEGKLTTGPFRNPGDGLLSAGHARRLALRLLPDGTFSAGPNDALAPEHFLSSALLSDRQQQRQQIYRQLLKPQSAPRQERPMLLAWADPADPPFALPGEAQLSGTALLGMPLRLERSPPGTRVTIPGLFIPVRRSVSDRLTRVAYESSQPSTLDLRFQLPPVVLPLVPERARFILKINARARRVAVASPADGAFVEHTRVDDPLGPIHVDLTDPRWLRVDERGGIRVRVTIGDARLGTNAPNATADADRVWTIEYLELEVTGRTAS